MFKNKTYKRKFIYLGVVTLFLFIIVFQLAIKKTINLKNNCEMLESNLNLVKNAPLEIGFIQKKVFELEKLIGNEISDKRSIQEIILEKSSKYCSTKQLVIKEFSRPHFFKNQNFLIETNVITFEGDFINLLQLLYKFEQNFRVGKVTSLKFSTYKDKKSKTTRLTAKLYIQTIKIYENEY